MAMTRARREAAERLRRNNEYLEEKYSGKGAAKKPVYKTGNDEMSVRPKSYKTASQARHETKKAREQSYVYNAARNARDIVNNVDPYAWQSRGNKPADFKPIWSLTGIFDALDTIKKDKERKADSASLGARQASSLMKQQGGEIAAIDRDIAALSPGLKKESATKESALKTMLAEGDPVVIRGKQAVDAMANGIVTDQIKADAEAYRKLQEQHTSSPVGNQRAALNADKKFYSDAYDAAGYQYAAQGAADYKENVARGAQVTSEVNRVLNGKYTPADTLRDEALGGRDTAAYITMTRDEIDTYRYWLAKNKEVADRYIKHLKPQLIERASDIVDQNIEDIENEGFKKVVRGFMTAAGSGKNVGRAIRNIPAAIVGSEDVEGAGIVERGQQKMAQRLEGVEKGVNDFIYNMIPMIPTAAVSMVPGVGAALSAGYTAARSYGGTYADTIQQGYAPGEAQRYALVNAASEAGMQYLLGGIAKTGGSKSLSSTLQRAAQKAANNPTAAKGLAILGNMGSEAAEGYLQANLDPVLRNIILDENNELNPVSRDKWEAAVMEALMSLVMNAPSDISEGVRTAQTGRAYNSPDVMQALVQQGLASGADAAAYGQAQRLAGKLEAEKNISNFEAGSLARANEAAIAAEARANAILDKTGAQRAYDPNETVKLKDGREVVIVARDGSEYTAIVPGENGYTRITIDEILHREGVRRAVDAFLHPEDKADITGKYDHRHVEKTADQTFLDKLTQGRGVKAVVEDMPSGTEAFYDRSTNTIHFAPDSTRADVIGGVTAHELAHAAEASKHYKAYSDYAVQRLFGNDADALRQAVEAKQEQYIQHGVYLSDADAVSEIVADYTRNLYKSPADIETLVTGSRGMAQSIYDSIRTAIQKIRAFFKGDEAALRNIREYQDLRRAQKLFERALSAMPEVQAEAAPAYSTSDVEIPTRREAGMIDIADEGNRIRYEQEIDGVFDGSLPTNEEIIMGRTPEILMLYGALDVPLHMTQKTVRKMAYPEGYQGGKHNLGIQAVKDLPEQLIDPIAILTNKSHPNNSVVVISEWNDVDGNRVIVPIEFSKQGTIVARNHIKTAFGRMDLSQYLGANNENILYTRNNENIADLLAHGRQLPESQVSDDFSTNIIPQTDRDVNRKYSIKEDGISAQTAEKLEARTADEIFMEPEMLLDDEAQYIGAEAHGKEIDSRPEKTTEELREQAGEMTVTEPLKVKKTARQAIGEFASAFQRKFVDSGHEVAKLGSEAENRLNAARSAVQTADYNVGYARGKETHQTDLFGRGNRGESLAAIFKEVNQKGLSKEFQDYMYHLHNADRMNVVEKAEQNIAKLNAEKAEILSDPIIQQEMQDLTDGHISSLEISDELRRAMTLDGEIQNLQRLQNKPIFGREFSAEASEQIANQILKEHPEFSKAEKKIRNFIKNNMEARIEAGLVTRGFAKMLDDMYPHYVPVHREGATKAAAAPSDDVLVGKTVGRAVGGDGPIGSLEDALARQTRSIYTNGRKNVAIAAMMDAVMKNGNLKELVKDAKYTAVTESEAAFNSRDNSILFFKDGARIELEVTPELAEAFRTTGIDENTAAKVARRTNNAYKKLITQWNPAFIVRNFFKDLQDALVYSKHGIKKFIRYYRKALSGIKNNSDMWQLYQGSGGFASSIFENMIDAGVEKKGSARGKFGKILDGISQANMTVEQAPRFAEFMATIESYGMSTENVTPGVLSEALYNANDITCNFGRSGTWGKMINRYAVPFFNPSIQGFDKLVRTFKGKDAKTIVKATTGFIAKSALVGILPSVANELLCLLAGDDEDKEAYARLSDYSKNAFYQIPVGGGNFLRIPKGRISGILGNLAQGITRDIIAGDNVENKTDWGAYAEGTLSNVAPTNPLENHIGASAIRILGNNKRWTGQQIETDKEMKDVPVAERYDETTSEAGKFLSQKFGLANIGISPKKADALIDEGLGVFGDLLLPLTSTTATESPMTFGFTKDSNISNKRGGQVYDLKQQIAQEAFYDEEEYPSKNDLLLDFIEDTQKPIWENKDKVRELNEEGVDFLDKLIGNDPRQREISGFGLENAKINESILGNYEVFTQNLEKYYKVDPQAETDIQKIQAKTAYLEAYRDTMGADLTVQNVFSDSQKKDYEEAHKNGVSAEDYTNYVIQTNGMTKNADKAAALLKMGLDADKTAAIYSAAIEGEKTKEKNRLSYAIQHGISVKDFIMTKNDIDEEMLKSENGQTIEIGENQASPKTTIPEANEYELPNYKGDTLEKITNIGVSPEDYAYIDDRISAHEDKVAYLKELGFDGKQLSGLVENFVMGKTAKDKMRVAEENMNIDNGTYIDAYIFGYSSVGSKSERNAQIRDYVNGLSLSDEQKDALYGWVKVSRGKTEDGKQTGGSSVGSSRRGRSGRRSSGKSAAVSQEIPDAVWNELRANVKTPTIKSSNPVWETLEALLDRGDKIREETMQQELEAVDATPYMSSAWRAERKREIRKRYGRGMAS